MAVVLAVLVVPARAAQAATPVVYQGHVYSSSAGAASADKPQSKLWHNAGSWWALMVNAAGSVNIFELQADHRWRDTGTVVDERASSTGDALWSGGTLYVASRTSGSSGAVRVRRFSYDAASRSYRSGGTPFSFGGGGTESATIDKDSTGALWVTFTRGSAVWVSRTTDAAQTAWTAPFRISGADTAVSSDDISAVVAFDGKIGVLWSDQASHAIRFAHHVDGAADSGWTVETPLSGTGVADDHLNIKSLQGDDQGRLYAAVKTSLTASTDPILMVLTRTSNGAWSAVPTAKVSDGLTRPQVVLDKTNRVLHVLQSTEGGGSIFHKSSPLSDRPSFPPGKGAPFITWSGAKINDVSTSKHPVTSATGLVAIASDQVAKRYYHAELGFVPGGPTQPPPPPPPAPGWTYPMVMPGGNGVGSSPDAAALRGSPRADFVVKGTDGFVYLNTWNGSSWSGYRPLGAPTSAGIRSDPAVVSWGPGRLDVFVRGVDDKLWQRFSTNGGANWSGWFKPLGNQGILASGPDVAARAVDRVDVFVRGVDGQLFQRTWDGASWGGSWLARGGILSGDPTVVSWGPGRLDVFARGTDGKLWQTFTESSTWSGWFHPAGTYPGRLAAPDGFGSGVLDAASWGPGHVSVFVRSVDNQIWETRYQGGWSAWSRPVADTVRGGPGVTSRGVGKLDVFARALDGSTHQLAFGT